MSKNVDTKVRTMTLSYTFILHNQVFNLIHHCCGLIMIIVSTMSHFIIFV